MPRMTSPDGGDAVEVSSPREVTRLRAAGYVEHVARTKRVRAQDRLNKAATPTEGPPPADGAPGAA